MSGAAAGYRLDEHVADAIRAGDLRIVLTGAGGWLGRATLELLGHALGDAFERRVVCFGSAERIVALRGREVRQHALATLAGLPAVPSIVLHLAFLTRDRAEAMAPAAYLAANRALSRTVLDALDGIGALGVFVPSSGAAARADDPAATEATRLYGMLKRDDEESFAAWADADRRRRAIVARVFALSGPYINKHGTYALASFIADALAGRPVAVRATRPVWRSYLAIREMMGVVLALLLDGRAGTERFDAAGDAAMEMREIARIVADLIGDGRVAAAAIAPDLPADFYLGDPARYTALRAARGIRGVPFAEQLRETAGDMAAQPA